MLAIQTLLITIGGAKVTYFILLNCKNAHELHAKYP